MPSLQTNGTGCHYAEAGVGVMPNFVANVEALSGAIAGSNVVVIRNATHGLPYENPADFNAAVVGFLQSH